VAGRFSEIKVKIFYIGVKVFQIFPDHRVAKLSCRTVKMYTREILREQFCNTHVTSSRVWTLGLEDDDDCTDHFSVLRDRFKIPERGIANSDFLSL